VKGAAAALAGAVLFFLGVLSAASDGGRVSPPPAIPLGEQRSVPPATASATPATGPAAEPAPPGQGGPGSIGGDPSSVPPAGGEPPAPGGSGGVEEVGGQVDCVDVGPGPGDGSCPPGQAKKAVDPPKDKKGDGDGRQ
jgi:hypothetical protein